MQPPTHSARLFFLFKNTFVNFVAYTLDYLECPQVQATHGEGPASAQVARHFAKFDNWETWAIFMEAQ